MYTFYSILCIWRFPRELSTAFELSIKLYSCRTFFWIKIDMFFSFFYVYSHPQYKFILWKRFEYVALNYNVSDVFFIRCEKIQIWLWRWKSPDWPKIHVRILLMSIEKVAHSTHLHLINQVRIIYDWNQKCSFRKQKQHLKLARLSFVHSFIFRMWNDSVCQQNHMACQFHCWTSYTYTFNRNTLNNLHLSIQNIIIRYVVDN